MAYRQALRDYNQAEPQQKRGKARELLTYLAEDLYRDLPVGTTTLIDASAQADFADITLPSLVTLAGDSDYDLLRGISYYKVGQAGKEPLRRAVEKILTGMPTVSLKNMTVWLVGAPATTAAEQQVKTLLASKGIAVNVAPQDKSTLLIVNLSAARPDLAVTLPDGTSALSVPQRTSLLDRCANVIAVNAALPADLVERVGDVWTSAGALAPEVVVSMVQGMVKTIEAHDGKLSASEVMRRASDELLNATSRLEVLGGVKSSLNQLAAAEQLLTGKDGI